LRLGGGGVIGDFADHFVLINIEVDAGRIPDSDVQGAEDELGAAEVDGIADEGVDDLHERDLDRLRIFDVGDGMQARLGRRGHAADHALVKLAESFAVESGGAAGDSVDLDVGAATSVLVQGHWIWTFRIQGFGIRIGRILRSNS